MNKFKSKPLKEGQMLYMALGAGLVVLILFFIIFFPRNPKTDARLDAIEERLLNLEGGERISRIEDKISRLEKSVPLRLDAIEKRLGGNLQIKTDGNSDTKKAVPAEAISAPKKVTEDKPDVKEKTAMELKPKNIPETEPAKEVRKTTKARYHEIQSGDNLYNLSRKYGIKLEDLQRINGIAPGTILQPGQKILVSPE